MQVNNLGLLKRALQDQRIEGLECVSASDNSLPGIVDSLPSNAVVSEWRYGLGELRYEYHLHSGDVGKQLRKVLWEGVRGGHPRLTAVYSRDELRELTRRS